jgi:hypothetical protein
MVPASCSAHVCPKLAEIWITPESVPQLGIGICGSASGHALSTIGQQDTGPPPALSTIGPLAQTSVGYELFVKLPLPSCPALLSPQHITVPAAVNPQVCV